MSSEFKITGELAGKVEKFEFGNGSEGCKFLIEVDGDKYTDPVEIACYNDTVGIAENMKKNTKYTVFGKVKSKKYTDKKSITRHFLSLIAYKISK